MKRVSLSSAVLALALLSTGCPDGRESRDPQAMADIQAVKGQVDGLTARLTAVEGADKEELKNLEERINRLERGMKPVTVNLNVSGSGITTGGPVDVKKGGDPNASSGGGETGQGSETGDPGATDSPGSEPEGRKTKLGQRFGVDAWNDLRKHAAGETPKKGGRVRVHFRSQPDVLNTHLDNSAVTSYITGYINESLLEQDAITFKMQPLLAESWIAQDMLFEIKSAEPIEGVEWSQSSQKWVKKSGSDIQTWYKWEIRKTDAGHELLSLAEHMGDATETGEGWSLKQGEETKTFAKNQVAGVNRGTVFTFKLKKNATFHDGRPVTADDVVFSLALVKCQYVDAPSIRSYYEEVRPAQKLDDHTVRIVYRKQYFKAIEFAGGIVVFPKHVFDPENLLTNDPQKFGDYFNKHPMHRTPIGTGAYKFSAWDQGKSVTVTRYDDYHTPSKGGYLDSITWKFISETQAALAELRAGNLDFVPALTPEQFFKETKGDFAKKWVKAIYYYGNFGYVGWNMRAPPFNDRRVRLAMAHGALDIPKYMKTVLYGAATQVAGSQYIYGPAYDKSVKPYEFNPKKAERLLREAGWFDRDGDGVIENADGMPFEFKLTMPSGSKTSRDLAQIMLDNLRRLGIKMSVQEMEWAVFIKDINKRNFQACRLGWGQALESDPFQLWHSSGSENDGSNHCGFINPKADQIILDIRQTLDDEKRWKLQAQFQKILYETQPYLFLYCSPSLAAYNPRFHGIRFTPVRPGYDLREWYDVEAQGE